ncbi:MAG: TonB-dependent receptor, partial [Gammaproteobacteria bacterium]|nr:TonB-dependent receptor [Gammaproteobacteria bacterium]
MRSKTARIRAIPVRVKPVTAAVAIALGSLAGQSIAIAAELPDELVVTATRRDTTVQEVPYSIAAIGTGTLRDLNIDNLSGIARYSAGLTQVDQGARDGNLLIIRGLNGDSIDAPEFLNNDNDRVATYYGETPVYINLLPIDIRAVEVLRGPQGTLYGARSLGGTVRITPNGPDTAEFTIDAHVGAETTDASDDNGREADIVINAPLIEDTLALRALLGYQYRAGYIDYNYVLPNPGFSCAEPGLTTGCSDDGFLSVEDANFVRTRSAGLSLLWALSDDLEATASWRQQDRDSGGRNINSKDALMNIEAVRSIDLDTGNYVSGMRYTEPSKRQNDIYNLKIVWDNSLGELVSSTSLTTYKFDGRRDQTDFLLDQEYGYEDSPEFSSFTREQFDDEIFTQEVRLVSDNEGPINYIVGAYYQDTDFFNRSREFAPPVDTALTTYDNKTFDERSEIAVFGEVGFDVTDDLNLLVGARWFDYEARFRSCTTFGGDVDDPANCTPNLGFDEADDDDVLGKFTATYRLNENLLTYATFSQGYSTGKVNNGDAPSTPRYVEPEQTDNIEAG